MQISVVVPAFNETPRIRWTAECVTAFLEREFDEFEVIVVDDGSDVDAQTLLAGLPHVRCLRNDVNRGKGYSVRRGMLEARFDPVLFTDADLSTPIEEALFLWREIDAGADIAIGARLRDSSKQVRRPPLRRLMAFVFRLCVKLIALRGFYDTQCGFKMLRRNTARALFGVASLDRWGFDVEILFMARRRGLRVAQVPVSYSESKQSRLSFLTPLTMLCDLLRIRWNALRGRYDMGK